MPKKKKKKGRKKGKKKELRESTHLQIVNGAVMNVTRSVIKELVGKKKPISLAFELAIFSPVKNCT